MKSLFFKFFFIYIMNTYLSFDLIFNIHNLIWLNFVVENFLIYMSSIAILSIGISILHSQNVGKIVKTVGGAIITGVAAGATKSAVDHIVFGDSKQGSSNSGSGTNTSGNSGGSTNNSGK